MLSLKKVYRDELLQLALILSLLRVHPESYLENDIYSSLNVLDLDNGTSWRSLSRNSLRSYFMHPKSLDSVLLNYEREVFADLNALGRYNRQNINQTVTTYLLDIERASGTTSGQPQQTEEGANDNVAPAPQDDSNDLQLSQEVS